jgi:hypothetical protein
MAIGTRIIASVGNASTLGYRLAKFSFRCPRSILGVIAQWLRGVRSPEKVAKIGLDQ